MPLFMKKLIFTLLASFLTLQLFSQSMLRISTTDRFPIRLVIDGRYFKKHSSMLTVGKLPPGNHWVEVYAYDKDDEGRFRTRNRIYEGRVRIHRDEVVTCVIDANTGNADITRAPSSVSNYAPQDDDMYNQQPYAALPPDTVAISSTDNTNIISSAELNKLGKKVADKLTDTDKLKKMKAGLKDKSVSTQQVAAMFEWLNFENSRLEFAQWAYDITIDKEHYSELKGKFVFNSSKEKLDELLNSKH